MSHGYTGFLGELEHLKIETRLLNEKFASYLFLLGELEHLSRSRHLYLL
jgi:hypothetical protein